MRSRDRAVSAHSDDRQRSGDGAVQDPSRIRRDRWRVPLLFAMLAATPSCATYQSTYAPPDDGRVRPVWRDGEVRLLVALPPKPCRDGSTASSIPRYVDEEEPMQEGPSPGVLIADLALQAATRPAPRTRSTPRNRPHALGASSPPADADDEKVDDKDDAAAKVAVVAIFAIATLPAITFALAASDPGGGRAAATAADEANRRNDAVRAAQTASGCNDGDLRAAADGAPPKQAGR